MSGDSHFRLKRRLIPASLGVAMLVVVILAALAPNTGTVRADTTCQYGNCATTTPTPIWAYIAVVAIILVAAILAALLILRQRRKRPPAAAAPWAETEAGAGGAGIAAGVEGPYGPEPEAPAAPSYLEGPEDVAADSTMQPPPARAASRAAVGGAVAGEAAAGGAASDEASIDSLMDELDRISGEILKKDQRGKGPPSSEGGEKSDDTSR
jgi:hypothetical protein